MNKFTENTYLIMISVLTVVLVMISCFLYDSVAGHESVFKGRSERIEILENNYKSYKELEGDELLVMWIKEFGDVSYKINGASQHDTLDCSTAVRRFFNNCLGANIVMENTDSMKKRISLEIDKDYKKKKAIDCRVGDFIFFNKINNIGHVCMIVGFTKKEIRYVDVNAVDDGMGINTIKWGDWKIDFITEVPFSFFAGDILK